MKIGVIGIGAMGKCHVRVLRSMPEVNEIVIADKDPVALVAAKKLFGIKKTFLDADELLEKEKPDGVVIATLPQHHKMHVLSAFKSGVNVLVEKPISSTVEEGWEMIREWEKTNLIFTVGHIERFNPVIAKIREFIEAGLLNNIYLINTRRVGPFPKRLLGNVEGVLIDLSVHDFDIIQYLGGDIDNIQSQIIKTGKQEIYVKCLLGLSNGIMASSEFSWITPMRDRTIEIYGDSGMVKGDYFNQEVWFYENSDFQVNQKSTESFIISGLINTGKIVKYPMFKQEPLAIELKNFINSIAQTEKILVTPYEAISALEKANKIK